MYVYLITNLISGKQYIGSRKCYGNVCDDTYMGSSKYLNSDISKHGLAKFEKEILEENFKTVENLLERETYYIIKFNTLSPNGYNRFLPNEKIGFHMHGSNHSIEAKNKIKQSLSGEKNPNFGKKFSTETKEKMRKAKLGKPSPRKGISLSNETKEKISSYAKTRTGNKNSMYGKKAWNTGLTKDTDERLKKIGEKIKIVKSKLN